MLQCRLRYVAMFWPCCVPLCTCRSWIRWHLVAQHLPDIWLVGTWLPNSIFWHLVAQHTDPASGCPTFQHGTHVPNTRSGHSAVHIIWSRWTSFISAVILYDIYYFTTLIISSAAICDTLWTSDTSCTCSGSTVCIYFIIIIHCSLWRLLLWTLLLYGREFIGTPVRPDFSMFHSVSVCWLCYWSAPYMISLRYSITWWNCYYRHAARSIEPPVICWLFGPHVSGDLSYDDSVHHSHSSTVIFTLVHSYYPVCLTWNVIMMSCRPRVIQFLFSVTYCYDDAKLLYCRSVGAAFLISMDIVLLIRCWLYWTMIWYWPDDFYYADHGFWIPALSLIPMIILNDAWMMLWWFLLLLPIIDSTTGLVNYADHCYTMSWWCPCRRRCWCRLPSPFCPATSLSSRCWFALFVRQSSFVLMNISYSDDGSLVSSP